MDFIRGELIEIIESTELNALVIDLKEGNVYYDTGVQFFRDAGAVNPICASSRET